MNEVELLVRNNRFAGWKAFSFKKSINTLASVFTVEFADKWHESERPWLINAGDSATVKINGESILEGYIGKLQASSSKEERKLKAIGRDYTGDMVDCSVDLGKTTWNDIDLKKLTEIVAKPFGIKVYCDIDVGKKFGKIALLEGETPFEIIERHAKQRGILFYSDGSNGIILTNPGSEYDFGVLNEGQNIKSISLTDDKTERFSSYTVKGQMSGSNLFSGGKVAHTKSQATDDVFGGRYRPLLIISETATDKKTADARAQWEASARVAKGYDVTVTVSGWNQLAKGTLWDINKLVPLRAPSLQIDESLLIKSVTLGYSKNGRETTLELARVDSFKLQPDIKATGKSFFD
ncbi:MAG: hypothetical protein JKY93_01410 [Gammaproteobacteria bacterium]|nr:hypothetical protein [Gammaproteobacteria bacterium]